MRWLDVGIGQAIALRSGKFSDIYLVVGKTSTSVRWMLLPDDKAFVQTSHLFADVDLGEWELLA